MFRNFLRSLWDLMYCIYTFLIKWPLTFSPSYHTQEQIFIIIISFKWCVQYLFIQHLLFVHAILYHHTVLILRLFSRFLLLSCSCTFLLARLSWRLKWAFLIIVCPLSNVVVVHVVVVVNCSYFLLLQNHLANFNQTLYKASSTF